MDAAEQEERRLHLLLADLIGSCQNVLVVVTRHESIGTTTYVDLAEELDGYVDDLKAASTALVALAKQQQEDA